MKKRILTWLLAVVMMLSFSTTALADTEDVGTEDPSEETTPAYSDQDTITITKSFGDEYYSYSQDEVFYLVQTAASGVDSSGNEISDVPPLVTLIDDATNQEMEKPLDGDDVDTHPVVGMVTYSAGEAASLLGGISKDDDGNATEGLKNFVITLPDYEEPGTYTYTLREVTGNTLGVTYYSGEITLVVQVYYNPSYDANDEGSEEFIKIAYVSAETDEVEDNVDVSGDVTVTSDEGGDDSGDEEETTTSAKTDVINNDYLTGSLTVKKVLKGNMADTSDSNEFTFVVEFTVPEGLYWDGTVLVAYTDEDTGKTYLRSEDLIITYDSGYSSDVPDTQKIPLRGTVGNLSTETMNNFAEILRLPTHETSSVYTTSDSSCYTTYYYEFYLSDGESITFWNLPYGVTYRVYESNSKGYNVTYTLSDDDYANWMHTDPESNLSEVFEICEADELSDSDQESYPNGYLKGSIDLIYTDEEGVEYQRTDHDELITYNEKIGDPDTGISLDSLPYILLLIAVGAGAVVLISRKRLINEE